MTGRRRWAWRGRAAILGAGLVAGGAMIVVGCQSVTDGSPTLDAGDVPLYRASTSSSREASVSSSAARESERQASITTEAVHTSCEALSSGSVDAIAAVNRYVDAFNENSPDLVPRAGVAIETIDRIAGQVGDSISAPLSDELQGALTRWVDAARRLSAAVASDASMGDFNDAIAAFNDSQTTALDLCDAAY